MYTFDQTLQALHDVVDADPDRTNGVCILFDELPASTLEERRYAYDPNKPVCVVGHVLHRLGVQNEHYDNMNTVKHERNRLVFGENFTDAAVDLLDLVQARADEGYTWGDALSTGYNKAMERLLEDEQPDVGLLTK